MKNDIKAYNDFFVRFLLSAEKHEQLTLSFINAVLEDSGGIPIKQIEFMNPFNLKEHAFAKETVVDIRCVPEEGSIFHIEIQAIREREFGIRTTYYWAKTYSNQLKSAENYRQLKPVISINLVNFIYFHGFDDVHSTFKLRDNVRETILHEHLSIHFLELPKLKSRRATSKLLKWLKFFQDAEKGDKVMKALTDSDDDISKAYEEYKKFMNDEELKDVARRREVFLKDQASREANAREEGFREGEKKGEKRGEIRGKRINQIEIAKNLLQIQMSLEQIAKATGLTVDELNQLQENQEKQD